MNARLYAVLQFKATFRTTLFPNFPLKTFFFLSLGLTIK